MRDGLPATYSIRRPRLLSQAIGGENPGVAANAHDIARRVLGLEDRYVVAAFQTLEISNHTEQFVLETLCIAKALKASLVAELDGRVIGHNPFSPVTIAHGTRNW